jgi:hypothetical protein
LNHLRSVFQHGYCYLPWRNDAIKPVRITYECSTAQQSITAIGLRPEPIRRLTYNIVHFARSIARTSWVDVWMGCASNSGALSSRWSRVAHDVHRTNSITEDLVQEHPVIERVRIRRSIRSVQCSILIGVNCLHNRTMFTYKLPSHSILK